MRAKYLMLWTPGSMCKPEFNGLMACRVRMPMLYVGTALPWAPDKMREEYLKYKDMGHAAVDERVAWLHNHPDSPADHGKLFTLPSIYGRQFILQWQEDDAARLEAPRQPDGWTFPYAMTFGSMVTDPESVLRLADWTKRLDRASDRLGYGDRGFSIGRPDPKQAMSLIASLGGVLVEEVKGAAGERHLDKLYRMVARHLPSNRLIPHTV